MTNHLVNKIILILLINVLFWGCANRKICESVSNDVIEGKSILPVYEEAEYMSKYFWTPSLWMPDGRGIFFQENNESDPHSGNTCIKIGYSTDENSWVGIYWLSGNSENGKGVNIYQKLQGNKYTSIKLTLWAKGERGGERVQFVVGNGEDSVQPKVETAWIELTSDWRLYEIDLSNRNLCNVIGGFCWVTNREENWAEREVWFYLDDIKYEVY
jgi:hypothetical protein